MENVQRLISKKLHVRLLTYMIGFGDRRGIKRHGNLHMEGRRNIWFVFPYKKMNEIRDNKDLESRRIHMFWNFMDGDERHYQYFYSIYLRAIRQVLWITKAVGGFEIAVVPRSDPEAVNPLAGICSEIATKERFILGRAHDGSDLLKRTQKIKPIHQGGKHTKQELEETMIVSRPPQAHTVILVDDLVFSGRSIKACETLLRKAGAERVYAVCLYGYKRHGDNG